jgi:phosphoribosylformylglycinamidine synthase
LVDLNHVISSAFTGAGNPIVFVPLKRDESDLPDFAYLARAFDAVHDAVRRGQVRSAGVVRTGGFAAALSRMCFGNQIGAHIELGLDSSFWFTPQIGSLVLEMESGQDPAKVLPGLDILEAGQTTDRKILQINRTEISLEEAFESWSQSLENVFPSTGPSADSAAIPPAYTKSASRKAVIKRPQPRALLTVFPGINCEYDTARCFERAGAATDLFVMRNLTPQDVHESVLTLANKIEQAQILVIPGGFSSGDEPDGSGKFIAAVFRNEYVREAVYRLLRQRDGLMLGICNGFQALIKLGLVPYGEIKDLGPDSPTLTFNTIGRHISRMVHTKIHSTLSPWFALSRVNDVHTVAISHGEGRLVAPVDAIQKLFKAGQVTTLYVDESGVATNTPDANPNGSMFSIEGICSPDGRVLGKMAHSERRGTNVDKNIPGDKDQKLFESGVAYFRD